MSSRNVRIINLSSPEEKQWSKLAALANAMAKLIRALEWTGYESEEGFLPEQCPDCHWNKTNGHAPTCEMAELIKELDAPIPEET